MAPARTRRTSTTGRGTTTRTKSDIIEVDFDDYEGDGNAYMGDDPRAGVYGFKLVNVERHVAKSSGNKGIRWTFECTDPAYAGWRGFMYSDTDPEGSKWKTQQILKAVQGGQEKPVKLDLAKPDKFLASVQDVVGRVISDSWEDEDSGEVRTNSKLVRVVAESAAPKRKRAEEVEEDDEDFEGDDGFDDDEDVEDEDFDDEDSDEEDDLEDDEDDADDEGDVDDSDDDDEEDEPEPEPAPRRRRTAAPAKKASPARKAAPAKKAAPARRSRR